MVLGVEIVVVDDLGNSNWLAVGASVSILALIAVLILVLVATTT